MNKAFCYEHFPRILDERSFTTLMIMTPLTHLMEQSWADAGMEQTRDALFTLCIKAKDSVMCLSYVGRIQRHCSALLVIVRWIA